MKKYLLLLTLIPSLVLAENLVKNGDMSAMSGWKGDRAFEDEPGTTGGNRVLVLKADDKKPAVFSQVVDTDKLKDVLLKFRYMSKDYKGRGLELRGDRGNGSTFTNSSLVSDGAWHEKTWVFTAINDARKVEFIFSLLEGSGTVFFDDITIEKK